MSRRTVIRRATFVTFLVAWPIVVECAKRRFPHEAGVHGIPAVASLVVYVACAAARAIASDRRLAGRRARLGDDQRLYDNHRP